MVYRWIIWLLLVGSSIAQSCPPPYPGANCTLNPITFPSVPPQAGPNTCTAGQLYNCGNLTGAGTRIVDPNFGSVIFRLTDTTTGYPGKLFESQDTTESGSGDEQLFNCNSTMIVTDDTGSRTFPKTLNASIGVAGRIFAGDPAWSSSAGFFINTLGFWGHNCANHPAIMYNLGNATAGTGGATGTILGYWDFTNLAGLAPSFTTLVDFAATNCLGTGYAATWTTNGGSDQSDIDFGFGFSNAGGQGTGVNVGVWRNGSGFRCLNISTLTVTGDWGSTGTTTGTTCNTAKIHNVKLLKAGGTDGAIEIDLQSPGCADAHSSPMVWTYGATGAAGLAYGPQCTVNCSSHWTEGMKKWVNQPGNAVPNFIDIRSVSTPGSSTGLINALPSGGIQSTWDWHPSWNVLDDTKPFCSPTSILGFPITKAWSSEVMCFSPTDPTVQWRFNNTFTLGNSPDFQAQYAIGACSQDGKYCMFTSDWMGTLGGVIGNGGTGQASCVPGGPIWQATVSYGALPSIPVIFPTAGNTAHDSFKATTPGTSGTVQPAWDSVCATTCTDGAVTWTNMGSRDTTPCRADVFLVQLNQQVSVPSHRNMLSLLWWSLVTLGVVGFAFWKLTLRIDP